MAHLKWLEHERVKGKLSKLAWLVEDSQQLDKIPTGPGAYVLIAGPKIRFRYPAGMSSVFYIGQSKNLRRRLNHHALHTAIAADPERRIEYGYPLWEPRYEYGAQFGARFAYIPKWQGLADPKDVEDIVLAVFALRFRSFPVANGAGAWRRVWQIAKAMGLV